MDDATKALVVLGVVVALFVWNRLPVSAVAILAALGLWATDLVTTQEAVAGFGDPVVIFIATLFVVSEGIDSTGVTTWAGRGLLDRAGTGRTQVLLAVCLLSALLTSLITLNGAVAALLPLVVLLAQRLGTPPAQLLMPVAFAGSAGGLLMLMSSPVNVIVSDAAADSGEGPFAFFSFALVGIPLLVGTMAICALLGRRLLPTRMPDYMPPDLGQYAAMVQAHYALGAEVPELVTRDAGVAEVVVPPRSRLVGERVHPGMRRENDLIILAVQRLGRDVGEESTQLAEGDALLLHGRWTALEQLARDRDVLLVDSPEAVRRQAVPWGAKATRAVLVLAALVAMLASGQVPPAIAGLTAALAMVLFRVVTVPQAYRSISWETVVLVGALIPLSTAISSSGAADDLSSLLIDIVGSGRPYLLLGAIFLLTAVLGQVVSNTATVLVVVPIAVAAAQATGTSVKPVLMVVAIAGCAALLTPIATPGNMMIMTPGGYRFGDYWKLGLPIMVWWAAVAFLVVPIVWRL